MPVQKSQSKLMAKLGGRLKQAHEKHKNDETTFGNMGLPAGIEGGVARLVDCKFSEIKADAKEGAGELMFYAAGVVVSPTHHQGIQILGGRTQISEPLYDTPKRSRKTVEEHIAWIYNELRKLGVSTNDIDPADLESICAALKEAGPYFKFRTWKGGKQVIDKNPQGKFSLFNEDDNGNRTPIANSGQWPTMQAALAANPYADGRDPMTRHDWGGACEFTPEEGTDHVTTVTSANGSGSRSRPTPGTAVATGNPDEFPDGGESLDADAPGMEGNNLGLIALGEAADNGDDSAIDQVTVAATEAGITEERMNSAPNWAAVAEMVAEATLGGVSGEEGAGDEEQWEPKDGDLYLYKPINPKTKKPVAKAVEVQVVKGSINKEKQTFNLLNYDDKKTVYRAVGWDKLENES